MHVSMRGWGGLHFHSSGIDLGRVVDGPSLRQIVDLFACLKRAGGLSEAMGTGAERGSVQGAAAQAWQESASMCWVVSQHACDFAPYYTNWSELLCTALQPTYHTMQQWWLRGCQTNPNWIVALLPTSLLPPLDSPSSFLLLPATLRPLAFRIITKGLFGFPVSALVPVLVMVLLIGFSSQLSYIQVDCELFNSYRTASFSLLVS